LSHRSAQEIDGYVACDGCCPRRERTLASEPVFGNGPDDAFEGDLHQVVEIFAPPPEHSAEGMIDGWLQTVVEDLSALTVSAPDCGHELLVRQLGFGQIFADGGWVCSHGAHRVATQGFVAE